MSTIESGLPAALVTGPALIAAAGYGLGRRHPRPAGRAGALVASIGFAGALALSVAAARGEIVTARLGPLELAVDQLAAALLLLVFGVSAIVQGFAVRYLAGDPRAGWFVGGAGLLTASSAGLAMASTLIGLAFFWTCAGLAVCLLLGMYWHLPAARDGVRRAGLAFLTGDLALWSAVALATAVWGRIELGAGAPSPYAGPALMAVAVLVVLAALSRSAQIPFHRWLPATLAAPTPVSALLHAGVVNAGGILLIRLAPLTDDGAARALTILAGAATMAYGTLVMLVKPDIKGSLVNSTTAQMGFMIMTCGLGLWGAAVFHLIAHGFYKATLFLSSGSAIAARRRRGLAPPAAELSRPRLVANAAAALAVPAAALALAVSVVGLTPGGTAGHHAEKALLLFAWVTGALALWGWLRRRPGIGGVLLGAGLLVPVALAYVAAIAAVTEFLAPALPAPALPESAVWVLTGLAVTILGAGAAARWAPGAERLHGALYSGALSAGHVPDRSTATTGGRR
jgi:NAD(P)H-quinone oxidoreductase subunit 5